MAPNYMPSMNFFYWLIAIFSLLGLANGLLFMASLRTRRSVWQGMGFCLTAAAGTAFFNWYTFAYIHYGQWMLWVAYLAVGIMIASLLIVPFFFLLAVFRAFGKGRRIIGRLAWGITCLAVLFGTIGAIRGNMQEVTEHVEISSPELPAAWDGFKIAEISDTHVGPYYTNRNLPEDFLIARREGAQMIALTGDLIDDVRVMPETARILTGENGNFPYGIIFVWGNHEYYRNKKYIADELKTTPVTLLQNNHVVLTRGGKALYIAGTDYPFAANERIRITKERNMADKAFSGIPEGAPVILLAHHSDFIREGIRHKAIITLTGHTHGMQTGFMGQPILTPYVYTRGLYRAGPWYGYVSRGTGGWFPFRWGCSREITIITLRRKG